MEVGQGAEYGPPVSLEDTNQDRLSRGKARKQRQQRGEDE